MSSGVGWCDMFEYSSLETIMLSSLCNSALSSAQRQLSESGYDVKDCHERPTVRNHVLGAGTPARHIVGRALSTHLLGAPVRPTGLRLALFCIGQCSLRV